MQKRILSLALSLLLAMSLLVTGLLAAGDETDTAAGPADSAAPTDAAAGDAENSGTEEPAADQPSFWAIEDVTKAIKADLVPENLQNSYTQATTRAEFCALATALYETLKGEEIVVGEDVSFTDSEDENVLKMATLKVVNGTNTELGLFEPDAGLTREEAATMLARLAAALDRPLETVAATFADVDSFSDWAAEAIGQAQAAGIMNGEEDNLFNPAGDYSREQSIVTMLRMYELFIDPNGTEGEDGKPAEGEDGKPAEGEGNYIKPGENETAEESIDRADRMELIPESMKNDPDGTLTRIGFCALFVNLYEAQTGEEIAIDTSISFTDTSDENVLKMASIGLVNGKGGEDEGAFDGNGAVNRGELAMLLTRLADKLGQPLPAGDAAFADVDEASPFAAAIGQVASAGILSGDGDSFKPDQGCTNQEAILAVLGLYDLIESK